MNLQRNLRWLINAFVIDLRMTFATEFATNAFATEISVKSSLGRNLVQRKCALATDFPIFTTDFLLKNQQISYSDIGTHSKFVTKKFTPQ